VDAYTVPLRPLDNWLPPLMPSGFFAHHDPYRKRMAETWFLAAQPDNPLITGWRDRMLDYWRTERRPIRFRHEIDQSPKGALALQVGLLLDRVQGPISARGRKKIYEIKKPNWAVSLEGGVAFPIYPYFAMAMLSDLMVSEDKGLFEEWRKYPKITSYDTLLLRHWRKRYDELTALDVRMMCQGKMVQNLSLPTKLHAPLMTALADQAEVAMPDA